MQLKPNFRTGQLLPCPVFLATVPRPAMIQALVRHVTDNRPMTDGQPIRSDHDHEGIRFRLETTADRKATILVLNEIRLACSECDRQDKDGITPEELSGVFLQDRSRLSFRTVQVHLTNGAWTVTPSSAFCKARCSDSGAAAIGADCFAANS
jgi:hypothetical protein